MVLAVMLKRIALSCKMKCCYLWMVMALFFSLPGIAASHVKYHCRVGDLMLQNIACGDFCHAIDVATIGISSRRIDHIAMVTRCGHSPQIIEAVSSGVRETSLREFLSHSSYRKIMSYKTMRHKTMRHKSMSDKTMPRKTMSHVWVARFLQPQQHWIPAAIGFAEAQLGKPYDHSFTHLDGSSYYCSSLISAAFAHAGAKHLIPQMPMNFRDPKTKHFPQEWLTYYRKLHMRIPQGKAGTNPGEISRLPSLHIVYRFGNLPHHG